MKGWIDRFFSRFTLQLLLILSAPGAVSASHAPKEVIRAFDQAWIYAKQNIFPQDLSVKFSEGEYLKIRNQLHKESTLADLAEVFNPFLESLGVSHTHFYESSQQGFYLLRSLFSTKEISSPENDLIGVQLVKIDGRHVITAVLEGSPAREAGLQRGDALLSVNGLAYQSVLSWAGLAGSEVKLKIMRNGKKREVSLFPKRASIHLAFLEATQKSAKLIKIDNKTAGYLHLWCGTNQAFLSTLKKSMASKFKHVDGLILDLRDGYGGAWWDYLDPFFSDREDYFIAQKIDRQGEKTVLTPKPKKNPHAFQGPMVVLINEGVRSGKEALAYQFKKSSRALLVGTNTAGAFVGGQGAFAQENHGYILYLSVFNLLLDGKRIEGIGVAPDIRVEYPFDYPGQDDPQLEAAKRVLAGLLEKDG